MNTISKMYEYNLWANTQLIELCSTLNDEQLAIESAGVFGRILPTLVHLVRAEGGYLKRLTGSRPWPEDFDWDNVTVADLGELAQTSGRQLIKVAGDVDPEIRHTVDNGEGGEWSFYNWTVVLQALYHGIEHRTQVKSLLTRLGVPHPELAAWDYTESLG